MIRKGDVVLIRKSDGVGHEQKGTRPAIVVSNNICNKYSSVIEVVFITTKSKHNLPTHVSVTTHKMSTALCEAVYSIDKKRIIDTWGRIDKKTMREINKALMISLELEVV